MLVVAIGSDPTNRAAGVDAMLSAKDATETLRGGGVVDEPGHRRLLSAGAAWAIIIVIVVVIIIVSVCACCFCCSDCPLHAPKRNRNAHAPPAAAAPIVVVASQSATDTAAAEKV